MSYTFEKKGNQVTVKIQVSGKDWDNYIEQAYTASKGKFTVQGFRKGFAPRKVIEKNYGEDVFYQEAFDRAFSKEYYQFLITEKQLSPIADPTVSINKFDENGVMFEAVVELMPEVKLGNYKGLSITRNKAKITDKEVETELKVLQEKQARFVDVSDSVSENGDTVTIDFEGSVDGAVFPGGTAESYRLELGSKSFIDTFEEQLVGKKVADKIDVNVKFPEDYHEESLKGKPALFKVTVEKIERKQLPEINDKFASEISEFETLEEFKADLKTRLKQKLEAKIEKDIENSLLEKIVAASEVEVPQVLVERQLDLMMRDMEARISYQGIKLEDYAKYLGKTIPQIREEQTANAKESSKTRLVLESILEKENITVMAEELDAKIGEMAQRYKKPIEQYKTQLGEKTIAFYENQILMDKLLNFLKANNEIK